jgi:hypothetical protein
MGNTHHLPLTSANYRVKPRAAKTTKTFEPRQVRKQACGKVLNQTLRIMEMEVFAKPDITPEAEQETEDLLKGIPSYPLTVT